MRRAAVFALVLGALFAPHAAQACSKDDAVFYETFLDTSCLQVPLTNTTLDSLGGLRLTTNGVPSTTAWNTDTEFTNGINYQSTLFAPVGVSTLAQSGSGSAAALGLPSTLLPLSPDGANPVLRPTAATVMDNDGVDDPAMAKVGSTYVMWYSGTAEDGGAPAIFIATSSDGVAWTRANAGNPVLQGTPGSFDADGVYGADVVYDAADATPYRMYYSGRAGAFGGIGYATSVDGVVWFKYKGGSGLLPVPVVDHGPGGSADSFTAGDPSVMKDGSTWKMWYTGDDSSKKRIAYATSVDGVTWAKGGKVIAPEDPGVSANIAFGAFAPTVWKTAAGYSMLLTGRKIVSGNTFQTKIMGTTSTDGIVWGGPSPALNPSGTNSNFDYSNLNSPELLQDPGAPSPFKLYYSGNTIDANGNFHTRIGYATSNDGNSFNKVNGSQTGNSVLDVGALGTAFDARQASGLSVANPAGAAPKLVGFYWGTRGSDFKPRLGEATSADGTAWTKVAVSAPNGGALFGLGNPASFDNGGQRDPAVLYDAGTYELYFTGIDSGGAKTIGFASSPEDVTTKQPTNAWSARSQVLGAGSSGQFDAAAADHPSVIKDGATYVMYYAGTDSGGTTKIGRATASAPGGPFTKDAGNPVLTVGAAGSFDASSVKSPVVTKVATSDYRLLYTGVDADGTERVGYATSADGIAWTKRGAVLNPSRTPYASDESGVEAAGALVDGSTLHVWTSGVDRTGRTRAEHATTAYPTPGSPQAGVPSGWATYQLGDPSTTSRDFRQIIRTSSGTGVALWMSFLQPYSSTGNEFWSAYFPVATANPVETLNFLLTVRGVRWQARLSGPGGAPSLDKVEIVHAPVSFSASGNAITVAVGPAANRVVTAWASLTAKTSLFSPSGGGSGSGSARVLDATTGEQLAASALNVGGETTLDLSGVSAPSHQLLRVALDLQSADGQATPRVDSLKVVYASAAAPPPPPPPAVLTLKASKKIIAFGQSLVLSGTLAQSGAALAAQAVALSSQPVGSATFAPLRSVSTDTAGAYSTIVKPAKRTAYKASFGAVTTTPVSVAVKHLVTLSARKMSGKAYLRGKVGPRHPRRLVVIQVRKGTRWVTWAKVRTSRRSTFLVVKALKPGVRYRFRARVAADREHLAGLSRVVRL